MIPRDEPIGPDPTVKPTWMSDVPVEVDVHSLETFAQLIRTELATNVVPGATTIQGRLAGEGSYNPAYDGYQGPPSYEPGTNRTFGVDDRLAWANMIGRRHMDCEASVRNLLTGLQNGLTAIASAAQTIANEYRSVEERNAMDVHQIERFFAERPTDGSTGGDQTA